MRTLGKCEARRLNPSRIPLLAGNVAERSSRAVPALRSLAAQCRSGSSRYSRTVVKSQSVALASRGSAAPGSQFVGLPRVRGVVRDALRLRQRRSRQQPGFPDELAHVQQRGMVTFMSVGAAVQLSLPKRLPNPAFNRTCPGKPVQAG